MSYSEYKNFSYSVDSYGVGRITLKGGSFKYDPGEFFVSVNINGEEIEVMCKGAEWSAYNNRSPCLFRGKSHLAEYIKHHDCIIVNIEGINHYWDAAINGDFSKVNLFECFDKFYDFEIDSGTGRKTFDGQNVPEIVSVFRKDDECHLTPEILTASLMMMLPLKQNSPDSSVLFRHRIRGVMVWQSYFKKLGKGAPEARPRLSSMDWSRIIDAAQMPVLAGSNGSVPRSTLVGKSDSDGDFVSQLNAKFSSRKASDLSLGI
ncbi:hypothetical protein ACETIH_06660 [Microvirga arabica]|uniref:Uncharacterized protein n=1 Tax=Microvirga arabica TaxID=1128671 RepID=A0ABV6Y5J0_9HYPH